MIFWLISVACLVSGMANYIKTVQRYSRRAALVQSGWKTEVVSNINDMKCVITDFCNQVFTVIAITIVAACILFLSTNSGSHR